MLLAMVRDLRVILVKLADRTHNMRTIQAMPLSRRRAVARETLEIYAPIAERLGLYNMKLELEDLGFEALYPHRYEVLERALRKARGNQKEFLKKIDQQLTGALLKNEIQAQVETREKHLYSIYKKMLRKRASLAEIVDVYGLRIITDKPDTCYRALGVVHSVFKPMPGRFKDYIAIPRVNGYQSLHTTLFGPNGVPIEAQIRTEDMHRVAEAGIAAHWKYKPAAMRTPCSRSARASGCRASSSCRRTVPPRSSSRASRSTCFPDKVYVFTPKGTILRLPERRDRRGLRVRGAHRHRQPLCGRQSGPSPDAASHRAAQWPDGGDHHRQGRDAESLLGQLRRHRQGAQCHPALPEEPAAHRGHRARPAAAQPGARGVPPRARGCQPGGAAGGRSGSSA